MDMLWRAVELAITDDAYHPKKKIHMKDITPLRAIQHAQDELAELRDSEGAGLPDPKEWADTMISLIHLAKLHGWTPESLELLGICKMTDRLQFSPEVTAKLEEMKTALARNMAGGE